MMFAMTNHACPKVPDGDFIAVLGTWLLPADKHSVAVARSSVVSVLHEHAVHSTDEVELVADELVANAIVHAGTDLHVILEHWSTGFRIAVQDQSRALPEIQSPELLDESGRGLVMIERIAHSWGHHSTDTGKCVWALVAA